MNGENVEDDAFQSYVIQEAGEALKDLGFALGGAQGLKRHGVVDRLSQDADFYTPEFEKELFDVAEARLVTRFEQLELNATVVTKLDWLRQIVVATIDGGHKCSIDLGQEYQYHDAVEFTPGVKVRSLDDLAAGKARALKERGAVRDYIDVGALLSVQGWDTERLYYAFSMSCGPTTRAELAGLLDSIPERDSSNFARYGVSESEYAGLRESLSKAAKALRARDSDMRPPTVIPSVKHAYRPPHRLNLPGIEERGPSI